MRGRWSKEKQEVAWAAREMLARGLVTGTSGNVSARLRGGDRGETPLMAVTPSSTPYDGMTEDQIVVVDFEMEVVEGELPPSSESLLHLEVYRRRPEVHGVVHSHSVYATVAAVSGLDVPPIIDEMVIRIGGPIRVSAYAFPGTQELASGVCDALADRKAALIRNHGAVAVGFDVAEALDLCTLTERLAQVFVLSSLLGGLGTLPADAVEAEAAMYRMRQDAERQTRAEGGARRW